MRVFESLDEYKKYFLKLIELERRAEMEFHLNEIRKLSGFERQSKGRAILNLKVKCMGEMLGYKTYRFGRESMPQHQIKVGDVVLISKSDPLKQHMEATVSATSRNYVEVMTKEALFKSKFYRMDLFVNDITFRRMKKAVSALEMSEFDYRIILGHRRPRIVSVNVSSGKLNDSQNRALKLSVDSELFLIHGPPGTGKTTTLAEVIRANLGKRILVCADSNVAVDNVIEHFKDRNIVRIGHPAKIGSTLLRYSIEVKITEDERYGNKVERLERRINLLRRAQEEYKKPLPGIRRGMSNEEILTLANRGASKRGITSNQIMKMAKWIRLQEKITRLYNRKNELIQKIANDIIDSAEIVFSTNSGAGSELLEDKTFDVVFIDEAAQATEPSSLIPIVKAGRVVFAGDHKQLPPTILSDKAKGLNVSMFERFEEIYGCSSMLTVQYRMNDKICRFPSCEFYSCRLVSDESVRDIRLSDIASVDSFLGGDEPVVFFNTEGKFMEAQKKGSTSRYNPREANFVKDIVERLLSYGVSPDDIGVITPYKDHEEYMKKIIENIEIKSVDGFQGKEKEVIVLSLVRANEEEEIGFLRDKRRLNVAITRAKRKLIIVGDVATLSSDPTYRHLVEYIDKNGLLLNVC